jgi:all-beta uncharacterized protein/BACON domain-containing protein
MSVSGWSRYLFPIVGTLAVTAAAGCQSASVTSGPTPPKCQAVFVAPPAIVAAGGTATIDVTAPPECGWDVSTQLSWISNVTPASSQGSGTVQFDAAPNPMPSARQGDILINEQRVSISQEAALCGYTVVPATLTMVAAGGPGTINVSTQTGCTWSAASDVPWIIITSAPTGSGNGAVRFSVASHAGSLLRTGSITIADQSIDITQSAPGTTPTGPIPGPAPSPSPSPTPTPSLCAYSIRPSTYSVGPNGGNGPTISVSAGSTCTWTAATTDSWITITSGAAGTGNGSVTFVVASNPTNARNGSITIAGQTFTVSQGTNCKFQLDRKDFTVPLSGDTRVINVTASSQLCVWTASSSVSWISIASPTTVTGDGSLQFVVAPSAAQRTATFLVAGQSVKVNQK